MSVIHIVTYVEKMLNVLGNLKKRTPEFQTIEITQQTISEGLIQDIPNDVPVLYYFTITNYGIYTNVTLAQEYQEKKSTNKGFCAVNMKKVEENDSCCLYVGKVRKSFRTRLRVHLGLGGNNGTQGLRSKEWLPSGVSLTLHYSAIELPKEFPFLVDPFEGLLKKELMPILGVK